MFKPADKVYFHRGAVELIGVVEAVSPVSVTLRGVELGFRSAVSELLTVSELDHLCVMDEESFELLSRDEPAFDSLIADRPPRQSAAEHTRATIA